MATTVARSPDGLVSATAVLVLYENFAVAAALARRLLDLPIVHLVRASSVRVSPDASQYDVVIVCPYVGQSRLDEIREWCRLHEDAHTSVLQLRDDSGAASFVVLSSAPMCEPGFAEVSQALALPPLSA